MQYRQVRIISGKGTQPHQFAHELRGIGIDRAGLIHAVGDGEVKVLDTMGKLHRRWTTDKPGYCVASDNDGVVFVGEAGQVERFDAAGKRLSVWQDPDRLGLITAIAFFGDSVFLADAQDRCIRRYDRSGKWLSDIGRDNNTRGFLIPNGHLDFAVDGQGIIHVANPAKHRIERYTIEGELLGHFGKFGMARPEDFPGCCNPTNLTLTSQGHVVVTEKAGPRMKVYAHAPSKPQTSASADSPKLLAFVGAEFFDANCKNMDVAVDPQGLVYVVDTVRLHICVFAPQEGDTSLTKGPASPTKEEVDKP